MNDELAEHPGEEFLQLRRDAEKRSGGYRTLIGFVVAPVLMEGTWFVTGESKVVKGVGVWIFCIGSVIFAAAFMRFSRHSEKLRNVRMQYEVTVRGVLGPVTKTHRTEYDYARFNATDFVAYRKMHFWGGLCGGALFAIFSWLFTIYFFRQFIWS